MKLTVGWIGLVLSLSGFASKEVQAQAPEEPASEASEETGESSSPSPDSMTPAARQKAAGAFFQEGKALAESKDYGSAVEKFDAAFEMFPDPALKFVRGEAFQLWGNREIELGNNVGGYDHVDQAVASYEEFLNLAPDPTTLEEGSPQRDLAEQTNAEAEKRINDLKTSRAAYEEAKVQEKSQAEAQALAERQAIEEEEARVRARKEGLQKSLGLVVYGGVDEHATTIARALLGGTLAWGGFGIDAHVGLDGFLRVADDRGTSARSFTVLDLGLRYGKEARSVGPFVAVGGSYGIVGGRPRNVKIENSVTFEIDRNAVFRGGLGYGFESSETTTVALHLDAQYWFYSVAEDQPSTPANMIDKPQSALALMLGVEFMLWK